MATRRQPSKAHSRYRLHVQLEDIEPTIWRTIWVEGQMSLGHLHHILQAAMGWTDAHLHQFDIKGLLYSVPQPDEDEPMPVLDERRILLKDVLKLNLQFEYLYDYGDSWRHRIVVDEVKKMDPPFGAAHVEEGAGACPPEDAGGTGEYEDFLNARKENRRSEEVVSFMTWAGEDFDPDRFDRHAANAALLRMAWNQWGNK